MGIFRKRGKRIRAKERRRRRPLLNASMPRLTREGAYFAGVLLFVISGAVAKQLNLLVLLCGMLLGPMVLHLRLVSTTLRHLRVMRRVPLRAFAGEPVYIQVGVENLRRRIPSWLLVLRDYIDLDDDAGRSTATHVDLRFPLVPAGQEYWTSYRLCLTRRGSYTLGFPRITTCFPLGLFVASRRFRVHDTLLVVPRIGRMTGRWNQMLLGSDFGSQKSHQRQGLTEADYYGLREWRSGDSRRWIHWRTSARLDTLAVRQFERPRQAKVAMLVDLWLPDQPTDQQLIDFERTVSFAATAVQELAREGGVQLTLVVCGATLHHWQGTAGVTLCDEVLDRLALVSGTAGDPGQGLEKLNTLVPSGARRLVISSRANPLHSESGNGSSAGMDLWGGDLRWVDVSDAESEQFFVFPNNAAPISEETPAAASHSHSPNGSEVSGHAG